MTSMDFFILFCVSSQGHEIKEFELLANNHIRFCLSIVYPVVGEG